MWTVFLSPVLLLVLNFGIVHLDSFIEPFFLILFKVNIIITVISHNNNLAIVKSLHELLKWWQVVLLGFIHQMLDNINQDESIKRAVVLLRLPEWSSFPVRHLFNFADRLVKDLKSYLCQTCLLLDKIHFSVKSLGIDEVFDVLYKVQVW
jgi:hypothetical protein